MKIGILIDRLNVGGVEKIALEQVHALREIGVDAKLYVMRKKSVVQEPFPDLVKNVPIVYLDQRLPAIFRFSFSFPFFYFFSLFHVTYPFFLPFVVKSKEVDYFVVHGTYTCLSAIALKKIKGIRFSAFIWDPASYIMNRVYKEKTNRTLFGMLYKIVYLFDKFIVSQMDNVLVGGTAHNKLIKSLNPGKRIVTIYPSVHPVRRPAKKQKYIQLATAWKRGKHPEYIIELAKRIPGIHIKMVGKWLEEDYYDEFMKQVKDNNLTAQVEVTGEVTEKELADSYARALVVLQTNDDKGFGMPALEAAGHATTFIIPRGQGVCKLFTAGKHGFYVKEKDTDAIVHHLNAMFDNPDKAAEMGREAWEKVRACYSWEKHAKQIRDLVGKTNVAAKEGRV